MFITIKRWIANIIYLLKRLGLQKTCCDGYFRILLYHCIGSPDFYDHLGLKVSLQDFSMQMRFLHTEGYRVFPLRELIHKVKEGQPIPSKSVAITFDDGYSQNIAEVLAILDRYNFTATFFITVGYIYRQADYSGKDYWRGWNFLSFQELKNFLNTKNTIGTHSYSHRSLTTLSSQEAEQEVVKSKKDLEGALNIKIDMFSYPHGKFNKKITQILEKNGYFAACSSISGKNNSYTDLFALRRVEINSWDGISDVKKKLAGCYDWTAYITIAKRILGKTVLHRM